jgi:hypothetical protein
MSNQFLKLRRSAVPGKIPETSSLDLGELAINTFDGQLFLKKSGSEGELITVVGSTGSFTGSFTGSLLGTASYSPNIYNSNGTLTSNRLVILDDKQLVYRSSGSILQNYTFTLGTPTGITPATWPASVIFEGEYLMSTANAEPYNTRVWGRNQTSGLRSFWVNQVFADITGESTGGTNIYNQVFATRRGSITDTSTTATATMRGVLSEIGHRYGFTSATQAVINTTNQEAFLADNINLTGNITNIFSYFARNQVGAGNTSYTTNVTNYYGFYQLSYVVDSKSTVTNHYGLFLDTPIIGTGGIIVNRWGVYARDSSMKHHINGNLSLGTAETGSYKLLVVGSTKLSGDLETTGSILISGSSVSLTGGSFSGSGANLYDIPASGITGLNLSRIAVGSVTASVNTDISASFRITSGSNTLLNVTREGFVWIGNGTFTNQAYQLDVQGTSRVSGIAYFDSLLTANANITSVNSSIYGVPFVSIKSVDSANPSYNQEWQIRKYEHSALSKSQALSFYNVNTESDRLVIFTGVNTGVGINTNVYNGYTLEVSGTIKSAAINATGLSLSGSSITDFSFPSYRMREFGGGIRIEALTPSYSMMGLINIANRSQVYSNQDLGGSGAVASAIFELRSNNKGFLIPRMTAAQRIAISSPDQGLLVYDTGSVTEGLWFYNAGSNPGWQEVLTNSGSQSILGSITASAALITGTLTAQTLVVQTITSSILYSSGSNIFGNRLTDTQQFTGSVLITGSTVSLTGGSFSGSGANLFNIPASGITGLNLSRIATGSISASVNTDISSSFRLTSGSNTLLNITRDGRTWIGAGTFADAAFQLDVNGTARVNGTLNVTSSLILENNTILFDIASGPTTTPLRIVRRSTWGTPSSIEIGALNTNISSFAVGNLTVIGALNSYNDATHLILGFQNSLTVGTGRILGSNNTISTNNGLHLIFGDTNTSTALTNGEHPSIVIGRGNNTNGFWGGGLYGSGLRYYADRQIAFGGNSNSVNFAVTDFFLGYGVRNENTSINSNNGHGPNVSFNPSWASDTADKNGGNITIAGGRGTGTGSAGDVIFATSTPTTTGTTLQSLTNRWWVKGSSGTLSNVSNPPSASLYISGSFIFNGAQFNNTSSVTVAGITTVSQLSTSSYTSCFYNYTVASASNARSGQVMTVWNGNSLRYIEVVTTDIGDTNLVAVSASLSSGFVRLQVSASSGWTFKNISNLL